MGRYDDLIATEQPQAPGKYAELLPAEVPPTGAKYADLVSAPEPAEEPGFLQRLGEAPATFGFGGAVRPGPPTDPAAAAALARDVFIEAPQEIPKGIVRGGEQALGAVGSLIQATGDYLTGVRRSANVLWHEMGGGKINRSLAKLRGIDADAPRAAAIEAAPEEINKDLAEFGKDIAGFWEEAASTGWEKRDKAIFEGKFLDRPSVARVVGGAAESAPTMLFAMGLSAAGAPNLGAAMLAGSEALPEYTRARELGVPADDALSFTLLSGIGTAALERVGLDAIMGKNPLVDRLIQKMGANWVAGAMVNFTTEGTQEAAQEIWQNAVAMGYDEDRQLFDGAIEAGIVGGFMGTTAGGARTTVSNYMKKRSEQVKGLTPQQIDKVVRDAMRPEAAPVAEVPGTRPLSAEEAPQGELIAAVEPTVEEQPVAEPTEVEAAIPAAIEEVPTEAVPEVPPVAETQIFTRDDGEATIEGEFVEEDANTITIRTSDGETRTLNKKFWDEGEAIAEVPVEAEVVPSAEEAVAVPEEAEIPAAEISEAEVVPPVVETPTEIPPIPPAEPGIDRQVEEAAPTLEEVREPVAAEPIEAPPADIEEQIREDVPVSQMNINDLRTRATELGVPFEQSTPMETLRTNVRQTQQGGFVDTSTATRKPQQEHTFIKQQRDNDKRVQAWQKQQTRAVASKLRSELVDRQGDVKKALGQVGGDEAVKRLVLRQGSSAEAARQFKETESEINKVLPRELRTTFKDYVAAMRVVEATEVQAARGVELKSPVEAEQARLWLNDEFNNLPTEQRDAVTAAAQSYWNIMRGQLDALHNEGLISDEVHSSIAENHKFYSPRRFVEFIDPTTMSPTGRRVHDSGVDALGKGSDSALEQDPMYLMAHVITRTQSRIFQNRANRSLYELANSENNGDVVRVLERTAKTDEETGVVTFSHETPQRGEGVVKVFIDGNEVHLAMKSRMAEEWNGLPPALSMEMAKFLQWASGTKVLKALATGINPEFAISNLPRDAMYAWKVSGQYSLALPKALFQLGSDYKKVTSDAIHRRGAYIDYIKEGGGMDFLTTQGAPRKQAVEGGKKFIRQLGDILAWAGETSEIATRLAVRDRAMRNGLNSEAATFEARNMLDFSQGGTFTKAADNMIPYLNAAVQGTRGGFRAFKTDPVGTSFKAAQLMTIGYGMAYAIASFFPELWDSLPDREKATKWIIPLPWKEEDKNGNIRNAYIAIPKDQFQQFFAAVGQSFADGQSGRPWGNQVITSLQSISPVDATTLPPIAAASVAYFGNYDTWNQEQVWRGYDDISASKEQTWRTPEIATDTTDLAARMGIEISPERLATATSKIVPSSNPIGGILASLYAGLDENQEIGKTVVEKVKETPGLRRLLRFSRPTNVQPRTQENADRLGVDVKGMTDLEARQEIEGASRERADIRQPLNVSLDKWLAQDTRTGGDLRGWLRDNVDDRDERQRLWNRARTKYPEDIKGPYSSTRRSRPLRSRSRNR